MISTLIIAACSWSNPGHNPYMGDVPSAVDSYKDIPSEVRAKLKARMESRKYDDLAVIRRDSIDGYDTSYTDLRSMHFGKGTVCSKVNRNKWADKHEEIGLIYCESEHCVIVPTVCRNVSRVTKVVKSAPSLPPVFKEESAPLLPLGENFATPQTQGVDHEPTFRTASHWIVAHTGQSYIVTAAASQSPHVKLAPSPGGASTPVLERPRPSTPVVYPPASQPSAPPSFPQSPPPAPASPPPVSPPWTREPPVSAPVPEPESWALFLAGLTAISFRKKLKAS